MTNVTLGAACPKCGSDMKVIDGTYNITNGVITAFRGSGIWMMSVRGGAAPS